MSTHFNFLLTVSFSHRAFVICAYALDVLDRLVAQWMAEVSPTHIVRSVRLTESGEAHAYVLNTGKWCVFKQHGGFALTNINAAFLSIVKQESRGMRSGSPLPRK